MIILFNANSYLGGGETLLVRFAIFLHKKKRNFIVLCKKDSFIAKEMSRNGLEKFLEFIIEDPDFYYKTKYEREKYIAHLRGKIINFDNIRLITFCMRDLHVSYEIKRNLQDNLKIIHLVLHIEDDRYVGQTILDKIIYLISGKRKFSNKKSLEFNREIIRGVNGSGGLIIMAQIIYDYWNKNFGLVLDKNKIIPLPSFVESEKSNILSNEKKYRNILWVGRIIDFKIPALLAAINFICRNKEYSLSIVGAGDINIIKEKMRDLKIDEKRVNFLGEVEYSKLKDVINGHGIGYAMGTSLVEIAKYKLPVIVALASYSHKNFSKDICGGIFYEQPLGCDGSDLILNSDESLYMLFSDAVGLIEENYEFYANQCYEYSKVNFSEEVNFNKYLKIIDEVKDIKDNMGKYSLKASFFRRFLFKIYKKL